MGPYSTSMHSQLFIFLFIQQWDAFEWSDALCSISVPYNGKFRPYYLLKIKWKNKTTKKYQWKGLQRWSLNDIQLKCRYMLFKLGIEFIHRVEETKCLAFWGGLIGRLTIQRHLQWIYGNFGNTDTPFWFGYDSYGLINHLQQHFCTFKHLPLPNSHLYVFKIALIF